MQSLPEIVINDESMKLIEKLDELSKEFRINVDRALRQKCGCYCKFTRIFGTLE
jgi:hypothetical protein